MYRRSGRGRLLLFVFLALSIAIITLDFRESPSPLDRAKDISSAVLAPIQRGFTAVTRPIGNFFASLGELGDLRGENARLEEEVEELRAQIGEAEAIQEENAELRALLELDESYLTMERVTASVIGRAPSNYKWAVTIDKGRADGLKRDMAVIAVEGLVGKVIETGEHTATVLLLIDPDAAVRARLQEGRDQGLIRGNGADQPLSLELIGTNAEAFEGDGVITGGLDNGIYPPGIPIGTVLEVGADGGALDKDISIEPFVDFNKVDFVQVLLETGPRVSQDETP